MCALHRFLLVLLVVLTAANSRAGDTPGVRAEYFNYSSNVGTPSFPAGAATVDRVEDNISVYLLTSSPAPGIGADYYLVRYTGTLLIPTTGKYTFQLEADDGVRLYVDCDGSGSFQPSEKLIDAWIDQSTTAYTASCSNNLQAGTKYRFQIEYYERGGFQSARLSWSGPAPVGSSMVVVPKGDGTQGLYSGVADNTSPSLLSALLACGGNTQVTVTFSKPMQAALAQNTANYSLSGGHVVTAAAPSGDLLSVVLTVSPGITATRTLTVNNLVDTSGNALANGSTASVQPTAGILKPGLLGTYYGQGGTQRAYFTGATATRTDATVDFDWGSGTSGVAGIGADDFSVRWAGLIKIPTSGNYVFRTQSDDGVRLYINGVKVIDNWTDHSPAYDSSSTISLTAGALVPVTLEYYERGGGAVIRLQWQTPGASSFVAIPSSQLFTCNTASLARFVVSTAATGSTCSPQPITITAVDGTGATLNAYLGTVSLSTTTGRGDWTAGSGPAPSGTLTPGAANSGLAQYAFAAGDSGVVKLQLSHSLAQSVSIGVNDAGIPAAASTGGPIRFSSNAFVLAEDLASKISGSNVVVAGRNHDIQVSLYKQDPITGSCGVASDFTGSRNLKLWRTDNGGPWAAPTVVAPALTIPASRPGANNLSLTFNAGVATFNLGTTDIGKYTLNLDDDSLTYASSTISGSIGDLTVRPFSIAVYGFTRGATANPSGSTATDAVFAPAGASFSATVGAFLWSSAADTNGNGTPGAAASLASVTAGGLTPSFASTVTLSPLAGSQTPAGGVLGTLSNATVNGFSGGSVTVNNLQYSEVGSFQVNNTGVVTNFLGTAGLSLDAVTFAANGTQNRRVGRFVPNGFALSGTSITHRTNAACNPASTFTYLGENFKLAFTLTAQNAAGATTQNYTGGFDKLSLASTSGWGLSGIAGTTSFKSSGISPRVSIVSASGSWSSGVSQNLTLIANVSRGPSSLDGPYDTARFGIAPTDSDGVTMNSFDLDTDSPANGNDATLLGQIPLRWGRLRLQNAIGAATRSLALPLAAQYWDGATFATNAWDSCTSLASSHLSFGNLRPKPGSNGLLLTDLALSTSPVTLANGLASLTLAAPNGHAGSVDVAIALGASATDNSCLKASGWPVAKAATAGANLSFLGGAWCSQSATAANDPSARATFGAYRGADGVLFQRENY